MIRKAECDGFVHSVVESLNAQGVSMAERVVIFTALVNSLPSKQTCKCGRPDCTTARSAELTREAQLALRHLEYHVTEINEALDRQTQHAASDRSNVIAVDFTRRGTRRDGPV